MIYYIAIIHKVLFHDKKIFTAEMFPIDLLSKKAQEMFPIDLLSEKAQEKQKL